MSSFEYSAKNVNKAIENACAELNLSTDEIKYDILSHGSSGIFGLAGVKKAKIRVHLPEIPKEPDTESESLAPNSGSQDEIYGVENKSSEKFLENDNGDVSQLVEFEKNPLDLGRTVLQRIVDSITDDAEISAEETYGRLFLMWSAEMPVFSSGKKGKPLMPFSLW